jgi:rod shape-determining protein MreC
LKLPNVPRQADIREGDLVVTSGLGDRFPGGYPVATISTIDRQKGQTFLLVEAMPLAALDRGREVLLIHAPAPLVDNQQVPVHEDTAVTGASSGENQTIQEETTDESGEAETAEDEA